MDKIQIFGGNPLVGEIKISGSKNSALPIMAASLLTDEKLSISNVPKLSDIDSMIKLLKSLNVKVKKKKTPALIFNHLSLSLYQPPMIW